MLEMEYWPDYTTPNEKPYTLNHVKLLDITLGICKRFRTAIQAGGSIGYWPKKMSERFDRVITFEPEPIIRSCLEKNLSDCKNIEVRGEALGARPSKCAISKRGFGSHIVVPGDEIDMITIDSLQIKDLDLIQLDIEGYELFALQGGKETIKNCKPIIQVEILEKVDGDEYRKPWVESFLDELGYKMITRTARDYVFVT